MKTEELPAFFDGLEQWARGRDGTPELVTYGEHEDQVIELRRSSSPGVQPLALVFHGGFWRARIHAQEHDRARRRARRGGVVERERRVPPPRAGRLPADARRRRRGAASPGRLPSGRRHRPLRRRAPRAVARRRGNGRRVRGSRRRLRPRRGRPGGARRACSPGAPRRVAGRGARGVPRGGPGARLPSACRRCWSTDWATTACRSRTRRHTPRAPGPQATTAVWPRSPPGTSSRSIRGQASGRRCSARWRLHAQRSPERPCRGRHRDRADGGRVRPHERRAAGGSVHGARARPAGAAGLLRPRAATLGSDPPRRRPRGPQGPPDVLLGGSAHLCHGRASARGDGDPRGRAPRDAVHHRGRPSTARPDPWPRRSRLHAAADRGARAAHRADRRRPDRRVRLARQRRHRGGLRMAASTQSARRALRIPRGRPRAASTTGAPTGSCCSRIVPPKSWPVTRGGSSSSSATASPPSRRGSAGRPTTCSGASSPRTTRRTIRSASSRSRACRST